METLAILAVVAATIWQSPYTCDKAQVGVAPDDVAFMACASRAANLGLALKVTRQHVFASSQTIPSSLVFSEGAALLPKAGVVLTISGTVSAPNDAWVFRGNGITVLTAPGDRWSSWWGALAAARAGADAAPAMRAAVVSANGATVHDYPATYSMKSWVNVYGYGPNQTRDSNASNGGIAFPANVWVKGLVNVKFDHQLSRYDGSRSRANAMWFFDTIANLVLDGGSYNGTIDGLTNQREEENALIVVHNQKNPLVSNLTFNFDGGNSGGLSTAMTGDYVVGGRFSHVRARLVGQCADFGFIKDAVFDDWVCEGNDGSGVVDTSHIGFRGFSIIRDYPNAVTNNYLSAPDEKLETNSNVKIINSTFNLFDTCIYVASGSGFFLHHNDIFNCSGTAGGAQGVGVNVAYENPASAGFPVTDFLEDGDWIHDNGGNNPQSGVLISSSTITNSDNMSNIKVVNSTLQNNNEVGITVSVGSNLQSMDVRTGNKFIAGRSQIYPLGGALAPPP